MNRKQFLQTVGGATFAAAAATSAAPPETYNVLVVKADEHNPLYSTVHGHPFLLTPNMQRMARSGVIFENNYCPSPLCMPSRSATLSGRRVFQIQTYSNCNAIQFDYPSYGRVLRDQGVHTVHIGKVHAYNHSSTLGFSEVMEPGDTPPPGETRINRNPIDVDRSPAGSGVKRYGVRENPFAGDEKKVDTALRWLSNTAPGLGKPWTMELNVIKPHFPHFVTQELWDLYPQGGDLPKHDRHCESGKHPYAQDLRAFFGTEKFSEEDIRGLRRGYYGCVTFIDRQLGRILDAVEKSGLSRNTIVAYTSDHGEMLGKFGMWWKRSLYEDSVRVPLFVVGPGFRPGTRVKTPTDTLDLQATLFRATGARRPADWVGAPLQDIAPNDTRRVVFSEYQDGGTRASGFMIRKGKWKLLYYCAAPHQLFDLESDPDEMNNLFTRRPEVAKELEADLRKICSPEDENRRAEEFIKRELEAISRLRPRRKKA